MSTHATKKAIAEAPPVITGSWNLYVESQQFKELEALKSLVVTDEGPGGTERQIIGSVGASNTEIVFFLTDAYVTDTGKVDFVLDINDRRFHFTGTVDAGGKRIQDGTIKVADKPSREPDDDGSWSAQATGGPPDGDES